MCIVIVMGLFLIFQTHQNDVIINPASLPVNVRVGGHDSGLPGVTALNLTEGFFNIWNISSES